MARKMTAVTVPMTTLSVTGATANVVSCQDQDNLYLLYRGSNPPFIAVVNKETTTVTDIIPVFTNWPTAAPAMITCNNQYLFIAAQTADPVNTADFEVQRINKSTHEITSVIIGGSGVHAFYDGNPEAPAIITDSGPSFLSADEGNLYVGFWGTDAMGRKANFMGFISMADMTTRYWWNQTTWGGAFLADTDYVYLVTSDKFTSSIFGCSVDTTGIFVYKVSKADLSVTKVDTGLTWAGMGLFYTDASVIACMDADNIYLHSYNSSDATVNPKFVVYKKSDNSINTTVTAWSNIGGIHNSPMGDGKIWVTGVVHYSGTWVGYNSTSSGTDIPINELFSFNPATGTFEEPRVTDFFYDWADQYVWKWGKLLICGQGGSYNSGVKVCNLSADVYCNLQYQVGNYGYSTTGHYVLAVSATKLYLITGSTIKYSDLTTIQTKMPRYPFYNVNIIN